MTSSSVFGRFHPTVQKWIWDRHWAALREVQERSAALILDANDDVLIAAGTGQGKTEAAFFPMWSRISSEPTTGVRILYVAPLKALINDQLLRQRSFCEPNHIRVTAWHGDASATEKRRLVNDPQGVLLITPESLESLLVRHGLGASKVFGNLDRVVVDEVHAFFDTERGRQLQSLLARIEAMIGREVPRIGLSATLGSDREAATDFLRPGHGSKVQIVEVNDEGKAIRLALYGFESKPLADAPDSDVNAEAAAERDEIDQGFHAVRDRLFRTLRDGGRHLIFANRRDHVERITDLLRRRAEMEGVPNDFFAHHGSLSKELRESVEQRLTDAGMLPTVVVCTSTLELGIDIGQMKSVVQVGSPPSVASLRQRLGRSGRGEQDAHVLRVCLVEAEIDSRSTAPDRLRVELFQTLAMLDLLVRDRWCEPPRAGRYHFSTLLQQVLALIMQNGGIRVQDAWKLCCHDGPFRRVEPSQFGALVRSLAKHDLLFQTDDGSIVLTEKGEKITNHYSFYVTFQTGEEFRLICRGETLGHLPITEPLLPGMHLIFAGRRWRVVRIDDAKKIVELAPDHGGRTPKFEGRNGALVHDEVRRRMRELYSADSMPSYLDGRAQKLWSEGRHTFNSLGLSARTLVEEGPRMRWIPWCGDRAMQALALWLRRNGVRVALDGVSLEVECGRDELQRRLVAMSTEAVPHAHELAADVLTLQHEKYDQYVPHDLLVLEFAERFLDVRGAADALGRAAAE